MAQFHLAEAEPKNEEAKSEIDLRRRVFWLAYGLDRLVCGIFRLPFSVPDDQITVPVSRLLLLSPKTINVDKKVSFSSMATHARNMSHHSSADNRYQKRKSLYRF